MGPFPGEDHAGCASCPAVGIAAVPCCPRLLPCSACSARAHRHVGTRRCTEMMGMAGQHLAGDLLGQHRRSRAASRCVPGISGSCRQVTVPTSVLPGTAILSGMMSFRRWLWHQTLGHGCWPGDRDRMVWARGDGQMGSQGGRKGAAFKSLLFPLSATNQHLARSSHA